MLLEVMSYSGEIRDHSTLVYDQVNDRNNDKEKIYIYKKKIIIKNVPNHNQKRKGLFRAVLFHSYWTILIYVLYIFHKYLSILGVVRSGSIPQKEFLNDILILTRHSKQHNI